MAVGGYGDTYRQQVGRSFFASVSLFREFTLRF